MFGRISTLSIRRKTGSSEIGYPQQSTSRHHHVAEMPLAVLSLTSAKLNRDAFMTTHPIIAQGVEVVSAPVSASPTLPRPTPKKIKAGNVIGAFVRRAINPVQLWRAISLQWNRKAHHHTYDDAQLALYSKMLPGEFLHFGYFDQTDILPEETRLADITRAQQRYADLLLELVGKKEEPVLDVGCGMGGLSRMLLARGYQPTALTPDRLQVSHIQATMPQVPVIRTKFERLNPLEYAHRFGTVYTSESLQYLKLDGALPIMESILAPGGRWVACDFFYTHPSEDRPCHVWDEFVSRITAAGWKISFQRDITPNILPTLGYINMWASRFGIPLMQFGFLRLRRKRPGLHHLVENSLDLLEALAKQNIAVIDPVRFASEKRYIMLVMERA